MFWIRVVDACIIDYLVFLIKLDNNNNNNSDICNISIRGLFTYGKKIHVRCYFYFYNINAINLTTQYQ